MDPREACLIPGAASVLFQIRVGLGDEGNVLGWAGVTAGSPGGQDRGAEPWGSDSTGAGMG